MSHIPLIGITDFTDFEQVLAMHRVLQQHSASVFLKRRLHVGVMMSYKTLHGIPSRWQNIFPSKEKIPGIFASDEVFNCLHFADYDGHPELWKSLIKAITFGGVGINAVQLDMIWPSPDDIARAVYRFPRQKIEVILQVGRNAFEAVLDDPKILVKKLEPYESVISRVLLDKSGGRGEPMDADRLLPFLRAIKENFPDLGLVVAGGLGPDTIHLLEPIITEFPDISIDAQGRLRPSGSAMEPIDWEMARKYVEKALELLK
jgi:hypothetical protein